MSSATTHRSYQGDADYARMLQLHRDVFAIMRGPICCTAAELEWWRYQEQDPDGEIASAQLWESADGTLAGYVWPGAHYMNVMVHPDHRHLLDEMLSWSEERMRSHSSGRVELVTEAVESDSEHVSVLQRRGYMAAGNARDWRIRSLETVPELDMPAGYSVRHLVSREDLKQREALAEHRYAAHLARAPTYRPKLNLVVVAPGSRFAAFCTAWLDEQNQLGVFEPVECLPEFRRQGLTRAMMADGMRRLKQLGARDVCIVNRSENLPAKRLYESLGFEVMGRVTEWRKMLG